MRHYRNFRGFYFPETGRTQKNQVKFILNIIDESNESEGTYIIRTESDIVTTSLRAAIIEGLVNNEDVVFFNVNEWVDKYYIDKNALLDGYPDFNLGESYSKLLDGILSNGKHISMKQIFTDTL